MDRLPSILLVAGIGFFLLAFLLSGLYPYMITDARHKEATIEDVAANVTEAFKDLKDRYPVAFQAAFEGSNKALTLRELRELPADDPSRAQSDTAWKAVHAEALQRGRDIYVGEACWHCHSQYVRPVANESTRFGPVRTAREDNNALQRPVLWGTRRVGPDLTHEGGLRSNDWHAAHFWDPRGPSPGSVMPRYTWFLHEGYQVRRKIDPEIAQVEGLDPETTYGYPGIYPTEADAQAALERIRASLPSTLQREGERLFVGRGRGLNGDGLAVVAYLQWLGTWSPEDGSSQP